MEIIGDYKYVRNKCTLVQNSRTIAIMIQAVYVGLKDRKALRYSGGRFSVHLSFRDVL